MTKKLPLNQSRPSAPWQLDDNYSAQHEAVREAAVNYKKWGEALGFPEDDMINAMMGRMSFGTLKAIKLRELRGNKGDLERAVLYPAQTAGETAEREVLSNFYAHLGSRLSFSGQPNIAGMDDELIIRALDRAASIKELVTAHVLTRPMEEEVAAELAQLTSDIDRIQALPDSGDFEEDHGQHKTNT